MLQAPPLNALEWTLTGLLILYLLTHVDEFRDVTISAEVEVTYGGVNDNGKTVHNHHGLGARQDFFTAAPRGRMYQQAMPGSFTGPSSPNCQHCSLNSPGVRSAGDIRSISTGRYVYGPRGGLIWVPSKSP